MSQNRLSSGSAKVDSFLHYIQSLNMDFAALQASFKRYCEIAVIDQRYKLTGQSIWGFVDFSNLDAVQKGARDVISNIYQAELEKVSVLQLVYFKSGRRLTPVEISTENDVFKALSEYPAFTSSSSGPVRLGARFVIEGSYVDPKSRSDEQSSPAPISAPGSVKSDTETTTASATPSHTSSPTVKVSSLVIPASTTTEVVQRSTEEPAPTPTQFIEPVQSHPTYPRVVVNQDQFHVHLLDVINKFRKRETLCDLTLITQDQMHFNVHKIVLISASPYFRSLQEHGVLKERHHLEEVAADILSSLLDYIYGQGLSLNLDNVNHVLSAAYMLGIHGAIRLCEDFKAKFRPHPEAVPLGAPVPVGPVQVVNVSQPVTAPEDTAPTASVTRGRRHRKSTPYPTYSSARKQRSQKYIQVVYDRAQPSEVSTGEVKDSITEESHDSPQRSHDSPQRSHDDEIGSQDTDNDSDLVDPVNLKVNSPRHVAVREHTLDKVQKVPWKKMRGRSLDISEDCETPPLQIKEEPTDV